MKYAEIVPRVYTLLDNNNYILPDIHFFEFIYKLGLSS